MGMWTWLILVWYSGLRIFDAEICRICRKSILRLVCCSTYIQALTINTLSLVYCMRKVQQHPYMPNTLAIYYICNPVDSATWILFLRGLFHRSDALIKFTSLKIVRFTV